MEDLSDVKVGFIGSGKMAQAMSHGFKTSGLIKAENMMASSPDCNQLPLHAMKSEGISMTTDNAVVVDQCNVIILAVKPHVVPPVLAQLRHKFNPNAHLLISIAAGISTQQIEKMISRATIPAKNLAVVKVMPNTPALVLSSATAYSLGRHANEKHGNLVRQLFSSIGLCEEVPEKLMNAVTALSGSGPAYACMMIEAMADGAVKMGLPRDMAVTFAAHTLLGAGKLTLSGRHPAQVKDDVCSPGGCTIHGLHELERGGFRAAVMSAVESSAQQCAHMSQQAASNTTTATATTPPMDRTGQDRATTAIITKGNILRDV